MEPSNIEFMGAPCGKHGPYTFYKAFKYSTGQKCKILCLGQFFYVKILKDAPVCIAELQLLWEDRNHEGTQLSSVRLYFLPEHTPEGRLPRQGEDEVLAEAEKVVLRVEDLITWIATEPVTWPIGHLAIKEKPDPQENGKSDDLLKAFAANNSGLNFKDVLREQQNIKEEIEEDKGTEVVILSYPAYCRYRAILLRLEGCTDVWMKNAIVNAIGGFTVKTSSARVMFCRDTFEHPDLEEHEFRQDWLAPNLKGRPRKKRQVQKRDDSDYCNSEESENSMDKDIKSESSSSSSKDNTSKLISSSNAPQPRREYRREDSKPVVLLKPNNKDAFAPDEEKFLHSLYSFMRDRGTPIERIPTLGFREVDLYEFYSYAQKLGGYEDITQKRLWKHIYDKLGGHPANTSAATCTRRHYEKLLLPFERHQRGQDHKPLPTPYQKPKRTSESSDEYQPGKETLRIPSVRGAQGPLSQHNWRDQRFLERERKWEEMRRMKNLNRQDRGGMVRRTVRAELLHRQQVKAEQFASTSQQYQADVKPKLEPGQTQGQTKENHGEKHRYLQHNGNHYPGNSSSRGVKQEPRPSVIQQGPRAGGKPVLNPAPAPRSHLQPTVYGPPHIMVSPGTSSSSSSTSSSSSSKRPYPFTNSHTASSHHSGAPGNNGAAHPPSISIKDLDPYYSSVKRPNSAEKNRYTATIRQYARASSPIVINDDNDTDQPLDFSMKTMRKKETERKPVNHTVPAPPPARSAPEDGPVNLSVRTPREEKPRDAHPRDGHPRDAAANRYSPYHRPHSRPESHSSALGRPSSREPRAEAASRSKSPPQSQRVLSLPINVPTSAMAAIVHPAFPQLSGSNLLPPGVVSPQYAQPFIYQAPVPGLPTVSASQPKLATSQASVPGQALFLPTAPFVIPAAHLYPQLYGQAPPVPINQKPDK